MPTAKRSTASSNTSASEMWTHARLFPTAGLRSELERERRASSCLLAVTHGVPQFGYSILSELGAPKSPKIETFAEVRFRDAAGKTVIPDGAIVCKWGKNEWTVLVEVKTGTNDLREEQVRSYLEIARDHGYAGVLTISNQITASADESPLPSLTKRFKKVQLWHLSWWRILTDAILQSEYKKISDPDQAWILRELIHYLNSEASGAYGFEDMGEHWVGVRKAVGAGTLRPTDRSAAAVAEKWEQFTQYLCLSLSQELGHLVVSPRPRKATTEHRINAIVADLANDGLLQARLRVPGAIGDLIVRSDLRARQTSITVEVDAPSDWGTRRRVSWLLRQLDGVPEALTIEASYPHVSNSVPATLSQAKCCRS